MWQQGPSLAGGVQQEELRQRHGDSRLISPAGTPAQDTEAAPGSTGGGAGVSKLTRPRRSCSLCMCHVRRPWVARPPLQGHWQRRPEARQASSPHRCPRPRTLGASYPWPALRCLLISFSPSMIHCMIFWFFSVSSDGPGTSVPALFPNSAFLAFLLEAVPAFPLQKQELGVTC